MTESTSVAAGNAGLRARHDAHVIATYPETSLGFVRGEGCKLYDADGREFLDFLGGLAVAALGHAHPAVADAVAMQARTLVHTSNLYLTEPAIGLAERLAEVTGWPDAKSFFCNSGAEANEAALKLARRHGLKQSSAKHRVVTLEGSFHGRTFATLEATGQPAKHEPFAPLMGFVDTVPYDDAAAMSAAVGADTCAVLLEVVLGEGGVKPVPDDVLLAARQACDEHGALLICDEVQTGIGRTGSWFAFQQCPVVPDAITLAKALGNGMPIGALVAHGEATRAFARGEHASTFGGNPVTCAAANTVIDEIRVQGLVDRAAKQGAQLAGSLNALADHSDLVLGVRGRGLLLALELVADVAARVEQACRAAGLIVNAVAPDAVRLTPPLIVADEEIERAVTILEHALTTVESSDE